MNKIKYPTPDDVTRLQIRRLLTQQYLNSYTFVAKAKEAARFIPKKFVLFVYARLVTQYKEILIV